MCFCIKNCLSKTPKNGHIYLPADLCTLSLLLLAKLNISNIRNVPLAISFSLRLQLPSTRCPLDDQVIQFLLEPPSGLLEPDNVAWYLSLKQTSSSDNSVLVSHENNKVD